MESKILIFTIDNCKYCEQTKSLLKLKNLKFREQIIETADERSQLKKLVPQARSFPVIVINGKWIGGFTQFQTWLRDEKI